MLVNNHQYREVYTGVMVLRSFTLISVSLSEILMFVDKSAGRWTDGPMLIATATEVRIRHVWNISYR